LPLQPLLLSLLMPMGVARVQQLSRMYVCVCMCLFVRTNNKTKTVETTITKLATEIVYHSPHPPINIRSDSQRSRSQRAKTYGRRRAIEWLAWIMHSIECPVSSCYCVCANARGNCQNPRKWVQSLCAPLRPFRSKV